VGVVSSSRAISRVPDPSAASSTIFILSPIHNGPPFPSVRDGIINRHRIKPTDGLYLQVTGTGAKSWVFRFKQKREDGKFRARDMGLGGYPTVSLAEARRRASEAREHRDADKDPSPKETAQRPKNGPQTHDR
jgi:Arm domain-containing DNA-binding protein